MDSLFIRTQSKHQNTEYFSMKQNTDGSTKLGTLQMPTLLALAIARNAELNADILELTTELNTLDADSPERAELNELIATQTAKLIDVNAITSAKTSLDLEVERFSAVIKRTLDNRLKVRLLPNEPASEENYAVPFVSAGYVSYMKRENPTRSASVKKAAADALALKLANERTAKMEVLKAELVKYPNGTEEFNKILTQIVSM